MRTIWLNSNLVRAERQSLIIIRHVLLFFSIKINASKAAEMTNYLGWIFRSRYFEAEKQKKGQLKPLNVITLGQIKSDNNNG